MTDDARAGACPHAFVSDRVYCTLCSVNFTHVLTAVRTKYTLANAGWKETIRQLEEAQAELARLRAREEQERDRLLLSVRRDHMADNDCTVAPCAWCEDLMAILPDAQIPPPERATDG